MVLFMHVVTSFGRVRSGDDIVIIIIAVINFAWLLY